MTHRCAICSKTPEEARFTKIDGGNRLRSMCNLCRNAHDKAKAQGKTLKPAVRDYGSAWMNLGADCRLDWRGI